MGVTCYHCEDGLSVEAFTEGLHAFRYADISPRLCVADVIGFKLVCRASL